MELDLTTFILELLNFLILVWLLKHFLYRPVLDVIERRRAAVRATLDEAAKIQAEAEQARDQNNRRLREWEQEKRKARETMSAEIEQERARLLGKLKEELADERRKAEAREQSAGRAQQRSIEKQGWQLGAAFAARLLKRLAGAELERLLVAVAIEDLGAMSAEDQAPLQHQGGTAILATAYPLPDDLKGALAEALDKLCGDNPVEYRFEQDPSLIAGLHIQLGFRTLQANLRDELHDFAEWNRDVA